MDNENQTPLERAIAALGSQGKLAKLIGCTQQTVSVWVVRKRDVPPEHVPAISNATGIPKHELRPDLFEAPSAA